MNFLFVEKKTNNAIPIFGNHKPETKGPVGGPFPVVLRNKRERIAYFQFFVGLCEQFCSSPFCARPFFEGDPLFPLKGSKEDHI